MYNIYPCVLYTTNFGMYFVGEGFSTIMDTMENTLGAIPPEEMAFLKTTKQEKSDDDEQSKEITEQPKSQESKEEGL